MGGTMVLSQAERWCAANLLRYVPLQDLEAIAQTVTRGMVAPTSGEECLKIIIFHSDNPKSLLSRKKVTREVLFRYLYDNNVMVTASMEKNVLMDHVLKLWTYTASTFNLGENDEPQQVEYVSKPSIKDVAGQQTQQPVNQFNDVQRYQPVKPVSHPSIKNLTEQQNQQLVLQANNQSISFAPETSSVAAVAPGLSNEEVNELSLKFTEWFYKLLNTQEGGGETLGSQHFWQDCGIYLMMIFPSDTIEVMKKSAESVVETLLNTKQQHQLYFNPNLSTSGVKGKLDPHGLVMVFSCGTLHQSQNCVGLFEQMFLLARDPFSSNNWKVKATKLRLRSSSVESLPALQEENISQLIALPDCT